MGAGEGELEADSLHSRDVRLESREKRIQLLRGLQDVPPPRTVTPGLMTLTPPISARGGGGGGALSCPDPVSLSRVRMGVWSLPVSGLLPKSLYFFIGPSQSSEIPCFISLLFFPAH